MKIKELSRSGQASSVIRIHGKSGSVGGPSASGSSSHKDDQVSGQNPNVPKLPKPVQVYAKKNPVQLSNPSQLHSAIQMDLEDELELAGDPMVGQQDDVIIF